MLRLDCLTKAANCVNGERQQSYGSPENNFKRIAELWTTYLQNRTEERLDYITSQDVACMMMLMKIARLMSGVNSDDSWVDIAGYAACGAEICHKGDDNEENCSDI